MRHFKTAALVFLALAVSVPGIGAAKKMLGEGEGVFMMLDPGQLPKMSFGQQLSDAERSYLRLGKDGPFTLDDIGADLVFVEMLNVYCYACAQQAPFMNILHRKLDSREELRDRVRFIGIAVGNDEEEIAKFRDQFDIEYPIIADPEFELFDFIGSAGGTPFLLLYTRGAGKARAQLGLMRDTDRLLEEIASALSGEDAAGGSLELKGWRNLPPELTREQVEEKLRTAAAEAGVKVETIEKVAVEGEEGVYRISLAAGGGLWAKVAGRAKVCNVCHDIFFVLLFDDEGKVVGFSPITVTKYENVLISEEEAEFLRKRVLGLYVNRAVDFDPSVDAVSTATMSSEMIFDTIRRFNDAYEKLRN